MELRLAAPQASSAPELTSLSGPFTLLSPRAATRTNSESKAVSGAFKGKDYSRSVHVHWKYKQFNCPPNAMTSTCWSGWMRQRLSSRFVRAATTEDIEAEKQLIEEDAVDRMEKTLENVKSNFNTIRTGRASPSLLDRIEVECYESLVALNSVAQVSTPDGSSILIQPFDRSTLSSIERAISKSDVGLTPSNDGSVIRLFIPPLTTERRKELLKQVSKLSEEGKVAIRNIRRDAIKSYDKLQKEKKISAANVKDLSNSIQKITDDYVKKVEELFKQKEKELLTI